MGLMGSSWEFRKQHWWQVFSDRIFCWTRFDYWRRQWKSLADLFFEMKFALMSEEQIHRFLTDLPICALSKAGLASDFRTNGNFRAYFFVEPEMGIGLVKNPINRRIRTSYSVSRGTVHLEFKDLGNGQFGELQSVYWTNGGSFTAGGIAVGLYVKDVYRAWWRRKLNFVAPTDVQSGRRNFALLK